MIWTISLLISAILGLFSFYIVKNVEIWDGKTYQPIKIKILFLPIIIGIWLIPIFNCIASTTVLVISLIVTFDGNSRIKENSWLNKDL